MQHIRAMSTPKRVDVHYDETQDKVEQEVNPHRNQQVPLSAVEDGDHKR